MAQKPWLMPITSGALSASTSTTTSPARNSTQKPYVITALGITVTGASKEMKFSLRTQSNKRYFDDAVEVASLIGSLYSSGGVVQGQNAIVSFADIGLPPIVLDIGDGMILEAENVDSSNAGTLHVTFIGHIEI